MLSTRSAAAIPAALLVAIALLQIGLSRSAGLTPWKGGGFGMFSTVDQPRVRVLRIRVRTAGGEALVDLPPALDELRVAAAAWPSDANLSAVARRVRQRVESPEAVRSVRVEVWRRSFDPASGRVRAEPLRVYVDTPEGA